MDFEDLKVIWDSQNEGPLYAVDQRALHAIVRRRKNEEHRRTFWCYGREIVINGVCALAMFVLAGVLVWGDPEWLASFNSINRPVSPWHALGLAAGGAIWLYCAWYMWSARRRQLRREESMAASLHGDLERALAHIEFQIAIARSVVWWGLLPSWVAAGLWIGVMFHLKVTPAWAYGMMVAIMAVAFAFALACQRFLALRRYEPRRRELESLRTKLADPQH